jgi:predicted kinase
MVVPNSCSEKIVKGVIALWVLGPAGSGKSTLLDRLLPPGIRRVDQDPELEAELLARGLPLDMRACDIAQLNAIGAVRDEVAAKVWRQVAILRAHRHPLAFEATGNKPSLLRSEVEIGRAMGYLNVGIGLHETLASCVARNAARRRVLPNEVVESTWFDFEHNLATKVYDEIFGAGHFLLTGNDNVLNLAAWLQVWIEQETES